MVRFAPGMFGLVLFAVWVWAVIDVISTDRILVRNLEKNIWLLLVLFVPTVGAIAWLVAGGPVNAGFSPGSTAIRRPPSARGEAPAAPRIARTGRRAEPARLCRLRRRTGQRPDAEKCCQSFALDQSPPQPQPTSANARTAGSPGYRPPVTCTERSA